MKAASLVLCLTLTFSSCLFASGPSCTGVAGSETPVPAGLFEKKLADLKSSLKNITELAEKVVANLGKGPGQVTIDEKLVDNIVAWEKEYNHTNFSVYTSQMQEAIEKIRSALKASKEFGNINPSDIEQISDALVSPSRYLRIPMFGTKHTLYHLWVLMGSEKNSAIQKDLMILQGYGKRLQETYEQKYQVENILASGIKNFQNEYELNQRLKKAMEEYQTQNVIPKDLIESLISIAQKYQSSNMGAFEVLTPGHHEAMEMYENLTATHPWFQGVSKRDIEKAQWVWNQAVTPKLAQEVLEMIKPNKNSAKAKAEIEALQNALRFLGYR